jgi:predicted NAD/FAD-binding protein
VAQSGPQRIFFLILCLSNQMMDVEKIAVIGSGLAGLSVSNFISTSSKFKVTIIESAASIGMDIASVTVQDQNNNPIRLDAPMRGISKGYYPTLYTLYDYLKIEKTKSYNELAWSNWTGNSSIENSNSVFFSFFRLHFRGSMYY